MHNHLKAGREDSMKTQMDWSRQFISKKISFIYLTEKYIEFIEDNLNNRPIKTLDYKTPNEVFLHEINKEVAFITRICQVICLGLKIMERV